MQRKHVVLICAALLLAGFVAEAAGSRQISAGGAPPEAAPSNPQPAPAPAKTTASKEKEAVDLFQDLVQRIRNNVAAEGRALHTSILQTNNTCFETLSRLNRTLDKKMTAIIAANHSIVREIRKLKAASYHLSHLEPTVKHQKLMFQHVNGSITVGNAHAFRQAELAANKSRDAEVVVNALQAIFAMLSQLNGYNGTVATPAARFREQIMEARAQVKDAQVLRFLETTLQSMADLPSVMPSREDIANLRLLLSLLRSQLVQYTESVKSDLQSETQLWGTRSSQLKQQLELIRQNIERLRVAVKRYRSKARLARLAIKANNETLTGSVYKESVMLKHQIKFYVEDCRNKSRELATQEKLHHQQEGLLVGLHRTQFGKSDDGIMSRIMNGVKLPPVDKVDATGKRCCKFCKDGKKPCGNKCIMEEENCTIFDGCACEEPAGAA